MQTYTYITMTATTRRPACLFSSPRFLCYIGCLLCLLLSSSSSKVKAFSSTRLSFLFRRASSNALLAAANDDNNNDIIMNNNNSKKDGSLAMPVSQSNKKKKKKRRKATAATASSATTTTTTTTSLQQMTGPLSEQELAEHVSSMYMNGPGGVLRQVTRRRQRQQRMTSSARATTKARRTSSSSSSSSLPSPAAAAASSDTEYETDTNLVIPDQQQKHKQQDQEDPLETIRKLDRHPALLLNADYQPMSYLPLSLWNWQEAVKAVFSGKVTVVDVYPHVTIRAAHMHVPLPSVIALTEYVPLHHHTPAFTKRNVFLRDEYRCQYCSGLFPTRELSLDHVVPRCKGGRLHWDNAVTCCLACNGRKGSMDLREIKRAYGMRLLRPPAVPTQYELAATASRMLPRKVHPTWEPYLGKNFHQQQQEQQQEAQEQYTSMKKAERRSKTKQPAAASRSGTMEQEL